MSRRLAPDDNDGRSMTLPLCPFRPSVGAAQQHIQPISDMRSWRHGYVLEMILKDTHTCEHHLQRFDRWTQTACQEVERVS